MYELTPEEIEEWDRRAAPDRPMDEALGDPVWRLTNLYTCSNPNGEKVKFVPTPEQRIVIWSIGGSDSHTGSCRAGALVPRLANVGSRPDW